MPESTHWTVDRRVPLALIVTLLLQLGYTIWWAAQQESKDNTQDSRIALLESQRVAERLAVLEYQQAEIKSLVIQTNVNVTQLLIERRK